MKYLRNPRPKNFFARPKFFSSHTSFSCNMKFGKNLTQQQQKYPLLRFLDYKELKKIIKLEPEIFGPNSQDAADRHFNDCLTREIEAVNLCFSTRVAAIYDNLNSIVGYVSDIPIPDALRQVMRISEEVEILRRFAVWNAVAVVKILKKRTKAHNSAGFIPSPQTSSSFPTSEWWLSQQLFFSGSDFAELQAALESLASQLSRDRLSELSDKLSPELLVNSSITDSDSNSNEERCPICLERCVDAVELSSCGHRFCWKCVVLGPIAFAPGEYRLSRCSVCRNEQPLDPTKNFKSVVSNQLKFLSQLAEATGTTNSPSGELETIFRTAGGAPATSSDKSHQAIDSINNVYCASNFFCSLCCEPLLLEAITTTPCKHHFHRVCLEKYADPVCPLCDTALPLEQVVSRFLASQMEQKFGPEWKAQICTCRDSHNRSPCSSCGKWKLADTHELLTRSLSSLVERPEGHLKIYTTKSGKKLQSFDPRVIAKKKQLAQTYS